MANTEVGSAYISIYANLSKQFGSQIDGAVSKAANAFLGITKRAAVAATAITTTAAAGVITIGKQALDAYADYEQLAGGAQLMFGEAYDFIEERSQQAYKNVQMSQNDYLEQVNGFAVGLRESLGGNEQAAAELADRIITAEADVVAATGNTQESVQDAFNGIMKGNFQMLDNLRLGIKPSKEGMQEVIDKVNEWNAAQGRATNYTIDNYADCEAALVDYIDMVGMSGYAQEEAAGTIQGSVSMMKASWENFLTDLGKPIDEADLSARIDELIESATLVIENVSPVIERITAALVEHAPEILDGAMQIGAAVLQGIIDGIAAALPGLPDFMQSEAIQGVVEAWTPVVDKLREIGDTLAPYVQPALDALGQVINDAVLPAIERLGEAVTYFLEQFEPWAPHLMNVATIIGQVLLLSLAALIDILAAVINIVGTVLQGLMAFANFIEGLPQTVSDMANKVGDFFKNLWDTVVSAFNGMVEGAKKWASDVASAASDMRDRVSQGISNVIGFFQELPGRIMGALSSLAGILMASGSNAINGFLSGIVSMWNSVSEFVYSIPDRIWSAIGDLGNLLYNAGWNVLMGFYNGAVSAWNTMTGWLSSIGGWIQNLKGPLDYDRKLLIGNGEAIMEGLDEGLKSGYEDVKKTVSGFAPDLGATVSADVRSISEADIERVDDRSRDAAMINAIGSVRDELRQMRLVLNIDGRAFAEATVGEIDRAMGNMARRAVAR